MIDSPWGRSRLWSVMERKGSVVLTVDVEELVSRPTEESFCLLRFCRHGEVDLGAKARGGEYRVPYRVPPRSTDARHRHWSSVVRELEVSDFLLRFEEAGYKNEEVRR